MEVKSFYATVLLVLQYAVYSVKGICPNPEAPANGYITGSQPTITYNCNVGYELAGRGTNTCSSSNNWLYPTPTCNPVTCPMLSAIADGSFFPTDDTTYGTKVTYSCNDPFIPIPVESTEIECGADGQWTPEPPRCDEVQCVVPSRPPLEVEEVGAWVTSPGGQIKYGCPSTHQLNPSHVTEAECTDTGYWNPPQIPTCEDRDPEKRAFNSLDTDSDGYLSRDESGVDEETFNKHDKDGDMRWSFAEYQAYLADEGELPDTTPHTPITGKPDPEDAHQWKPIVGGLVGAIAGVIIIGVTAYCCIQKKKGREGGETSVPLKYKEGKDHVVA